VIGRQIRANPRGATGHTSTVGDHHDVCDSSIATRAAFICDRPYCARCVAEMQAAVASLDGHVTPRDCLFGIRAIGMAGAYHGHRMCSLRRAPTEHRRGWAPLPGWLQPQGCRRHHWPSSGGWWTCRSSSQRHLGQPHTQSHRARLAKSIRHRLRVLGSHRTRRGVDHARVQRSAPVGDKIASTPTFTAQEILPLMVCVAGRVRARGIARPGLGLTTGHDWSSLRRQSFPPGLELPSPAAAPSRSHARPIEWPRASFMGRSFSAKKEDDGADTSYVFEVAESRKQPVESQIHCSHPASRAPMRPPSAKVCSLSEAIQPEYLRNRDVHGQSSRGKVARGCSSSCAPQSHSDSSQHEHQRLYRASAAFNRALTLGRGV